MASNEQWTKRYAVNETSSYMVDSISYNMKAKHLLTATFSMGLIRYLLLEHTMCSNEACLELESTQNQSKVNCGIL